MIALIALVVVVGINLISVRWFGELEFWVALIKVVALVDFLIVGTVFLAGRFDFDGAVHRRRGIAHHGGLFPTGLLPLVTVTTGVVFAYAAVELVGIAAGEAEHPEEIMPRAINSVIARIAVFYVGSLVLLGLLLPYTAFRDGESPFVTFFSETRCSSRGFGDEPDRADRGVLQPQRGPVLHRPDPAVDVGERQRAGGGRPDVAQRRALCRYPRHRCDRADSASDSMRWCRTRHSRSC